MGYGDEIMITGYAKELKKKYPSVKVSFKIMKA